MSGFQQMFKLTFCLVTERQEITPFEKSKLVTACWSPGQGRTGPPCIIQNVPAPIMLLNL